MEEQLIRRPPTKLLRVSRYENFPHKKWPKGKLKLFAEIYAETHNLRKAYDDAGFLYGNTPQRRDSEARKKLSQKRVYDYINWLKEKQLEKVGVTVEWVVDNFKKVFDAAMANQDLKNANTALENLGKYLGMYVTKIDATQTNFNFTTEEELDKKFKELAAIAGVQLADAPKPN